MTVKEFLEQYAKVRNGQLVITAVAEQGQFCIECFEKHDELVKVTHSADPYGWRCPKGHFGEGQPLAKGGVVHGPNW